MSGPALALVALGGNLPPRRRHLLQALDELAALPGARLLARSALRETAPVGCAPADPPFVNAACLLETELSPRALLEALQAIERAHGRRRETDEPRNAPRTLDLDLVLHGDAVLDEPGLVLPHPRAHERLFVLEPAAEIAPRLVHPRLGLDMAELLARLREPLEDACAP